MAEQQQSSAAAAAVPAVLFNQAQEAMQTTCTTITQARAPSKNFVTALDSSRRSRHSFAGVTFTRMLLWLAVFRTFGTVKCSWPFATPLKVPHKQCLQESASTRPLGLSHNREMATMVKAWNSAKIQADIKTKVDALANADGEQVSMSVWLVFVDDEIRRSTRRQHP